MLAPLVAVDECSHSGGSWTLPHTPASVQPHSLEVWCEQLSWAHSLASLLGWCLGFDWASPQGTFNVTLIKIDPCSCTSLNVKGRRLTKTKKPGQCIQSSQSSGPKAVEESDEHGVDTATGATFQKGQRYPPRLWGLVFVGTSCLSYSDGGCYCIIN